jgi:dihydroflavonol-4-reductase
MRVLVTGASGFLGGWLVKRLCEEGLEVSITARASSDLSDLQGAKYTRIDADLADVETLSRSFQGHDSVFHLAGLVAYSRSARQTMEVANVQGTQNILTACQRSNVRRLVHMSSVVAVGASFDGTPLNENSKYNVGHLNLGYFETKRKAEELVVAASARQDCVILNPGTIYGPADAKKGSRKTQVKVAQGKFPLYPPGGVNVVSVHDVVDATVSAWKKGRAGERYILGNENLTIREVFRLIAEAAGVEPPSIPLPRSLIFALGYSGDFLERLGLKGALSLENAWTANLFHWFDSTKARQELGLGQRSAKDAIQESVNWMKEHNLIHQKS